MTEVCGATSHIMMEVGGATSSVELLKVIRGILSGNFYLCGNRYEIVYFMMRQKFLHRIEGYVRTSRMMILMEVCGSTNCVMMEVGGGASRTMKVGEDAGNTLSNSIR